jgi:glutathione peroxidase
MYTKGIFSLLAAILLISCFTMDTQNTNNISPKTSFHSLSILLNDGSTFHFDSLKGKKVLLVNTASQCGYTKQYEGLEALYQKYKGNLVIIAFPANDFGAQEPGSDSTIAEFCKKNYGVSFPIAIKSSVKKGKEQNEVFKWLSDSTLNGWNTQDPSWNFGKYLVDENGKLLNFFASGVEPFDDKIINALK